jgi:hypothetical protein
MITKYNGLANPQPQVWLIRRYTEGSRGAIADALDGGACEETAYQPVKHVAAENANRLRRNSAVAPHGLAREENAGEYTLHQELSSAHSRREVIIGEPRSDRDVFCVDAPYPNGNGRNGVRVPNTQNGVHRCVA